VAGVEAIPAVGEILFSGHFEHAVDDKGRVAVPIQFRVALSGLQEKRLVATKFRIDEHRCLDVYPLSAWRRLKGSLLAKNRFDSGYVRIYVSGAHELAIDAQGRVLLPPLFREYAGITRDVMITGDVDKFRIWDRQVWHRAFGEHELDARVADPPPRAEAPVMAGLDPPTGSRPASRDNPLIYSFVAMCDSCNMAWVCGNLLSHQHALIAMCLPWLCPECFRPLHLKKSFPKFDQPEGKPC
jgi:MraZ protein